MTEPSGWPGLGFDPAPGDAAAVDGLTSRLIDASRTLLGARDTLDQVRTPPGGWEGEAAAAFTTKVAELPRQLGDVHTSLDKVTSELHRWQGTLEQLQARARDLEARAVAARLRSSDAQAAATSARRAPDLGLAGRHFDTDGELADAQDRLNTALGAVNDADRRVAVARSELERLIEEGQRVLADHNRGADSAAAAIRPATEGLAPPDPDWLEEAGAWSDEHAGTIGDVAGVVSAVAGTLALIPPLTLAMGPIALVSGAVALGAHAVDIDGKGSWGDWDSWATLGGDTLGMLPAVGALSKAADAGMGAARLGEGLLTASGGATELASTPASRGAVEFGRVFQEGLQPDAAPLFQRLGRSTEALQGGNAEVLGKVEQAVVNLGLQAPTVNGWVHPSPGNDTLKSAAGYGQVGANWAQAVSERGPENLAADLARFARAVR